MKKLMLLLACLGWWATLFAQSNPLQKHDDGRYIINDSVLIKTRQGRILSATVVRLRSATAPLPVALFSFIYSNDQRSITEGKYAADHGYVGVVADVDGKRLSPDAVAPYEHDAEDVYEVIDWISKQPWCNGKVGMYGGSYSGFTQWASLKYKVHPALKTIVPAVSAIPGMGLPMENNVFLNANYGWAFYVTNNKYLDTVSYYNNQRWQNMSINWYKSGAPYRKIDSVDGAPNKWLQRWLKHPAYDEYWQKLVPYKEDYAKINIPVLAFDGYYDDGQVSGLYYVHQLAKYNPKADYYVILGPYDHFGTQKGGVANLRDYQVDPVALIDTKAITFQWFDYIMKNGKKPALVTDRINYEVMGANRWDHAPSFEKMHSRMLKLYLSPMKNQQYFKLSQQKPAGTKYMEQKIDFADRNTTNNFIYPNPIVEKEISTSGFCFVTQPLQKPMTINGAFSGNIIAAINKKDFDYSVDLLEITPKGEYFELDYFLGRASYAKDMTKRHLLHPGNITSIPFNQTKIVSRQLAKGSRLLVIVNGSKNRFAQINYGTGKDVSDESIADAGQPLKIKWYNKSYVEIPVSE